MASAPAIETSASSSIVVQVAQTPAIVLTDEKSRNDLFAHIKGEIEAFKPDITTAKGRDAIKSFAFKITRTKTAIDDAGKKLNEEARARIGVVDAARRDAREKLDEMARDVRHPLTVWEEREKAKDANRRRIMAEMAAAATVTMDDTSDTVRDRGTEVFLTAVTPDLYEGLYQEAQAIKDATVATLKAALARITKEEADRAELAALRAANEERERIEAERIATERAAQEAAERAQAEQERQKAAQKAEADRLESVRQAAAARAQREAEAAAEAERRRVQKAHDDAIAVERQKAQDAERAAQAERDRIAAQEAERQAEAKRIADAQAKREADQAHRSAIIKAAEEAIMTCGVDEEAAKKIVLLVCAKGVPNMRLEF